MTAPHDPPSTQDPSGESPGRLIAAGREAKSMGPADLAARLRLDTKVVKALERDDYENLPAPLFVKGYIRSIAKELDLDADRVLAAYATHASLEPPTLADFASRPPDQIGINSTVVRAATYGLAALLVFLMLLWWRSNGEIDHTSSPLSAPQETHIGADPLPYDFPIIEHDDQDWQFDKPESAAPSEDAVVAPDPVAAESVSMGQLKLTTSSEAWVEIYNKANDRLFFGMVRSDRVVSLNDQPYVRLIVGNTDSVTLLYNGALVDLTPYSQNGVAQLELGDASQAPQSE